MGSKSNSIITTNTSNDQSQIQALAAVRGDGNTTNILDGDAIRESYAYSAKVNDTSANSLTAMMGAMNSVASLAIQSNAASSNQTIKALQDGMSQVSGSVQAAYSKSANGGVDPQMLMLGIGAIVALAFIFKG